MDNRRIRTLFERLAPEDGVTETGLPGVQLARASRPLERAPAVYPPSLCILVHGQKRVFLGGRELPFDPDHYFCCTMPLPVEAQTTGATPDNPTMGIVVLLEQTPMNEVAIEFEAAGGALSPAPLHEISAGLAVVAKDERFSDALYRLLELVGDRAAMDVLGRGRLRELFYAILAGEAGPLIRQTFGVGKQIAKTIQYLRGNLREPMTIDEMASYAGMSRAVFHRKFKQATTLSPLQFVKTLRLNSASQDIARGMPIGDAASKIGYASPSQFSREFKRQYGQSPKQWSRTDRAQDRDVQACSI